MGAIPDILEQIPNVPVYGTKLTLQIVKKELSKAEQEKYKLVEIKPHTKIDFGKNCQHVMQSCCKSENEIG